MCNFILTIIRYCAMRFCCDDNNQNLTCSVNIIPVGLVAVIM